MLELPSEDVRVEIVTTNRKSLARRAIHMPSGVLAESKTEEKARSDLGKTAAAIVAAFEPWE